MLLYILVFIISIVGTYNAQRIQTKNVIFFIHSFFAIAPLVLLAAFRDVNVGTDTINYRYLFENAVENKNFFGYYIISHPSFEFIFLCYNFFIAQITSKIEIYYIITYGIIFGFTYASAIKLKKYLYPHIFILIYLFLFFSDSLNIMRQYIGIAFVFYAVSNLFERNYKLYLFYTIIACLFHSSAIISFTIAIMYFFIRRYSLDKNRLKYFFICFFLFFIAVNIGYFSNLGLLPMAEGKLSSYLVNHSSVSNSHIFICVSTLLLIFNIRKSNNDILDLMFLIILFSLIFYLSPAMNAILYRLVLYFNVMSCIAISYIYKLLKKYSDKFKVIILLFLYIVFYFFSIVISGTGEVIPYSSSIIGI